MSGDVSVATTGERGCYWHLVVEARNAAKPKMAPTKNSYSPSYVSSVENSTTESPILTLKKKKSVVPRLRNLALEDVISSCIFPRCRGFLYDTCLGICFIYFIRV